MNYQNTTAQKIIVQSPDLETNEGIHVPFRAPTALASQRRLDEITNVILLHKNQESRSILEIGKALIEAKKLLTEHGKWLEWLSCNVKMSERMAQYYVKLAKNYSNPKTVADLGMMKALALVPIPEAEREKFISKKYKVDGEEKSVVEMSVRELRQVIKQKAKSNNSSSTEPPSKDVQYKKSFSNMNTALSRIDKELNSLEAIGESTDTTEEIRKTVDYLKELINSKIATETK